MGDITTIWDGRAGFSDRFPSDRLSRWIVQLRDRVGWQKAAVALANKHARILWSILVNGQSFDSEHTDKAPDAIVWRNASRGSLKRLIDSFLKTCAAEIHHTGQTGKGELGKRTVAPTEATTSNEWSPAFGIWAADCPRASRPSVDSQSVLA